MRMFKIALPLVFVLANNLGYSQKGNSVVNHIIKQGETITSLAKQYHTSKEDIFRLNNLSEKTILRIGQKIAVPVGKSAATAVATVNTIIQKPVATKAQHLIVAGDNLLKIANQYQVTTQQLKDWNGLKTDGIRAGDYLFVSNPGNIVKSVVKPEVKPIEQEVKLAKVEPTKKVEPPSTVTVKPTIPEKTPEKEIKTQPIVTATPPATSNSKEDFFEKQYAATQNSVEGLSGTFKTIAGWHDKKYYVLLNNVESGSIVKISANNKFVYAKVLGPLPNIKDDNDLLIRVSNAAAASLGIIDNKFNAKVEF
jgi:LysM repeat protein